VNSPSHKKPSFATRHEARVGMRSTHRATGAMAALILGFAVSAPVLAGTFYVDTNHSSASDSNPGTEGAPWKTIQKAASTLTAGDTVLVKAGTYTELYSGGPDSAIKAIKPQHSGTEGKPITFAAYPGHHVVIDQKGSGKGFYISGRNYITIRGFEIKNTLIAGIHTPDNGRNSSKKVYGIVVENNDIHHISGPRATNVGGIRFDSCVNCVARNNLVHDSSEQGINSFGMINALIEHNEIWNIADYAVYQKRSDGKGATIRRNIIHDVGVGVMFSIQGGGDPPHNDPNVYENIIYKARNAAIQTMLSETSSPSRRLYIHSNVLADSPVGIDIRGFQDVEIWDNIFINTPEAFGTKLSGGWPGKITYSDYNVFYPSAKFFLDRYSSSARNFGSLDAWYAATRFDQNSLNVNPQFTNVADRRYTLSGSSQAKKSGKTGMDRGAYPTGSGVVGPTDGLIVPVGSPPKPPVLLDAS